MPAQLDGMNQLLQRVTEMQKTLEISTKEKALNAGAKVFKDGIENEIVSKGLVRTGNLKNNVAISNIKDDETVEIGISQQGDAYYGYFLEFGRKSGRVRYGKHKGRKYSRMTAKPFVGPAYENNKSKAQDKMSEVIREDLNL
ncbi:HK97 gp10 family phage protein [Bacillaceae bacterium Marseille-Q3522]|nr:HK97 gp10 family phage protein [Bacillaceae bacterium Marseille-Q3522]